MQDLPKAQRVDEPFSTLIDIVTSGRNNHQHKQMMDITIERATLEFARIVKVNFANNAAEACARLVTNHSDIDTAVGMTALSWSAIAEDSQQPTLRTLAPIMRNVAQMDGQTEHLKDINSIAPAPRRHAHAL